MTLIVANKDGIFGDTRSLDIRSQMFYSEKKIFPINYKVGAYIGISGELPKDDESMFVIGHAFSIASLIMHVVDTMDPQTPFKNPHIFKESLARCALLFASGYMHELNQPRMIVATKYHNINVSDTADAKLLFDAYKSFCPPSTFMAIGSSERQAYVYNKAGYNVDEVFKAAAQVDNCISRAFNRKLRSKDFVDVAYNDGALAIMNHTIHAVKSFKHLMKHLTDDMIRQMLITSFFMFVFTRGLASRQRKRAEGKGFCPFTERNIRQSYREAMLAVIKSVDLDLEKLLSILEFATSYEPKKD